MLAPRKTLWSTPKSVIDEAADLAVIEPNDVVYDVGCGDGRVLLHLASKPNTARSFIGIEINVERAQLARENIQSKILSREINIDIRCENALDVKDYAKATVIFLYLIPRGLRLIKPLLIAAAKEKGGCIRVITYMSPFENIKFIKRVFCKVDHQPSACWPVYLYHFNGQELQEA